MGSFRTLLLALLCLLTPTAVTAQPPPALLLETQLDEAYISGVASYENGHMAPSVNIQIFGPDGKELGRTTTDQGGEFWHKISVGGVHHIVASNRDGQRAESSLEIPASAAPTPETTASTPTAEASPAPSEKSGAQADAATNMTAPKASADRTAQLEQRITLLEKRLDTRTTLWGWLGWLIALPALMWGAWNQGAKGRKFEEEEAE
ncbi:hypothetical protein [Magnetofaba australis]|nr:hypothetical protein [Magnetofaba australis]